MSLCGALINDCQTNKTAVLAIATSVRYLTLVT
jgi:hypothetical protein